MKLSMLPIVNRAQQVRLQLLAAIDELEDDKHTISINGTRQDDALRALVKPVIKAALHARVCSIDRDLMTYGVELG